MIANEKTVHRSSNKVDVSNYRQHVAFNNEKKVFKDLPINRIDQKHIP